MNMYLNFQILSTEVWKRRMQVKNLYAHTCPKKLLWLSLSWIFRLTEMFILEWYTSATQFFYKFANSLLLDSFKGRNFFLPAFFFLFIFFFFFFSIVKLKSQAKKDCCEIPKQYNMKDLMTLSAAWFEWHFF